MADFDPNEFLKLPVPSAPKVPAGVGKRASEKFDPNEFVKGGGGGTSTSAADPPSGDRWWQKAGRAAYEYGKPLVTGAGKEIASDVQWLGSKVPDISSAIPYIPLPGAASKEDVQKAREGASKELQDWTSSEDPEYPDIEKAGRIGGTLAEAYFTPLPKLGMLAESALGRVGDKLWPKAVDKSKNIPISIVKKGVQGAKPNPAYQAAKQAYADAQAARAGKIATTAAVGGRLTNAAERGAFAGGAAAKTSDPTEGAITGGALSPVMQAVSEGVNMLPNKVRYMVDATAAAAIVEQLHFQHGWTVWEATKYAIPFVLGHHIIGSTAGQAAAAVGAAKAEDAMSGNQ